MRGVKLTKCSHLHCSFRGLTHYRRFLGYLFVTRNLGFRWVVNLSVPQTGFQQKPVAEGEASSKKIETHASDVSESEASKPQLVTEET